MLLQPLECKQQEAVPQHYPSEACRTAFHSSPVNREMSETVRNSEVMVLGYMFLTLAYVFIKSNF